MSCLSHFPGHFLIIDIGHPTTNEIILVIKKSLQDVLSLACNMRDFSRIPVFGCGVLAPSFQIIQKWKILSGNFPTVGNNLEYLINPSNIGAKVTLRDYRSFLENSIENIVTDFDYYSKDWKARTETKEKFNPLYYWPSQIQVTLITRKGGSLIVEILKKFQNYSSKLRKIEIVEISSSEDKNLPGNDLNFISHSIITESVYDLDGIFKRWISGDHSQCEQLQIILNKNAGFHIKCDISECLINPAMTTLPNIFSLSATTSTFVTHQPFHIPVSKPSLYEMEVVNKIEISNVCPSAFFGFPKWIYPTRKCTTNWDEFRYNAEIFRALCSQLYAGEIGLLSKLKPTSPFNKITPLFFIISDGMRLLMKNIVPVELRLLRSPEVIPPQADIEEEANSVVHSLIDQMEIGTLPQSVSTGIYDHFREKLRSELKKIDARTLKPGFESISKAKRSKIPPHPDMLPGEYIPKFLMECKSPVEIASTRGNKKTRKRKEDEPIHPALMSPEKMAKYRKYNFTHYQLPEVMEPGVLERL